MYLGSCVYVHSSLYFLPSGSVVILVSLFYPRLYSINYPQLHTEKDSDSSGSSLIIETAIKSSLMLTIFPSYNKFSFSKFPYIQTGASELETLVHS